MDPAPRYALRHGEGLTRSRDPADAATALGTPPRLDRRTAWRVLGFQEYPSRASFLEGVAQVPPRETVRRAEDGSLEFLVARAPRARRAAAPAASLLREAVLGAVGEAVASSQRVAVLLSGGLDSSVVAAALVGAWTAAGRDRRDLHLVHQSWPGGVGEEAAARAVAAHLGLALTVVPLGDGDPYEGSEACLRRMPTPVDDGGMAPLLGLMAHARDLGADAVLTGDGGDEAFEGWYVAPWRAGPALTRPSRAARHLARRVVHTLRRRLRGPAREWRARCEAARVPAWLEERAPDRDPAPGSDHPPARLGLHGARARRDRATRSARAGLVVTTLGAAAGVLGLRAATPLLDPRVLDLVVSLPPRLFVPAPDGLDKGLARAAFAADLPPSTRARGKDQPTAVPWLEDQLQRHAARWYAQHVEGGTLEREGLLDPTEARTLLAPRTVRAPHDLWRALAVVSLGAWCRARGL